LQIVEKCENSIAIDKMKSFCRSALPQFAEIPERSARGDRQNALSIRSQMCAGRVQRRKTQGPVQVRRIHRKGSEGDSSRDNCHLRKNPVDLKIFAEGDRHLPQFLFYCSTATD